MGNKPRALIVASVASMIDQFNLPNIQFLLDNGYDVDVACNCRAGNTISDERIRSLIRQLNAKGVTVVHVPIPRKITHLREVYNSFKQLKKLCLANSYAMLHCHSPIGSVIARLAARNARKTLGTKVIYTAHGFHFFKGAPLQNWAVFYPIEKACSKFTDVLITINKEDYAFAVKHLNASRIEFIPGVGVDTAKYHIEGQNVAAKRRELGISEGDLFVLSVGELNKNKNQEVAIRAIAKLKNPKVHFFIAGQGNNKQYLSGLADELGVNLHLLGYRADIAELLNAADVFILPSFREGLSVALMEAMAAGLPCVVSEIRGNVDLIDKEGGFLCKPYDDVAFCNGLKELADAGKRHEMGEHNRIVVKEFDIHKVMELIAIVYERIYES